MNHRMGQIPNIGLLSASSSRFRRDSIHSIGRNGPSSTEHGVPRQIDVILHGSQNDTTETTWNWLSPVGLRVCLQSPGENDRAELFSS